MASSKSQAAGAGDQQVLDISQLPIQQLNQFVKTLEKDVEYLQQSMQQLKDIQSRFVASRDTLKSVTSESSGKQIMVPLTSSLYAAGNLTEDNRVLIDIGTGYYVEKTINEASLYFKRKIDFISKQIEAIQPQLQEKYNMKQASVEVLQMKVQAAAQQQQQPANQPKA